MWWAGAKGKGLQPGPVMHRGEQSPWDRDVSCEMEWTRYFGRQPGEPQGHRRSSWAAENSFALKYKIIYKNQLEICFFFPKNTTHPHISPPKKKEKKQKREIASQQPPSCEIKPIAYSLSWGEVRGEVERSGAG